jgi:hypothetical protein
MSPEELERRRSVVGASEVGLLFGLPSFGGREAIVNLDPKAANELATKLMLHAAHATVEKRG